MNYDEAKKALHVLYADVNRKVLQMGPEMRASGLVSDDESDLCEALQVLRQEMFSSEPDTRYSSFRAANEASKAWFFRLYTGIRHLSPIF